MTSAVSTDGRFTGEPASADLVLVQRLRAAGLSTGEAVAVALTARATLRSDTETVTLAAARVLRTRTEHIAAVASFYAVAAEEVAA